MLYKAKVAVCSDIHTKHSAQSERHVEFLNVKPWWYVKKQLGVKRLRLFPNILTVPPLQWNCCQYAGCSCFHLVSRQTDLLSYRILQALARKWRTREVVSCCTDRPFVSITPLICSSFLQAAAVVPGPSRRCSSRPGLLT